MRVVILETKGEPSLNLIKEEINTLISERYNKLFTKLQENEADVFGMGQFLEIKSLVMN